MNDAIGGIFREPFPEQAAFFRQKLGNLVPTEKWTDMQKSAHDRGFMVAGAMSADLLSDLAAAVDRAIVSGTGIEAFRKDFKAIVAKNGWDYRGEFNWRTLTIYKTNMITSYAAGRLAQLREDNFSYWTFKHSNAAHPRQQHVSWNGLTLPADDPWWRTHYPPCAWGCMCRVKGSNKPSQVDTAPPENINPATGEPIGIDKGWGYMPGDSVSATVQAMAAKTVQWEYTLAKAYMESVPVSARDQLARSYRELPSVADSARQFAGRVLDGRPGSEYHPLGLVTSGDARKIKELTGVDVTDFDFTVDQSSVKHIYKHHGNDTTEAKRGQRAVTKYDYEKLPAILNNPDSIESIEDTTKAGRAQVMFKKRFGNETFVYVTEIRAKRRTLVAQSLRISKRAATD